MENFISLRGIPRISLSANVDPRYTPHKRSIYQFWWILSQAMKKDRCTKQLLADWGYGLE